MDEEEKWKQFEEYVKQAEEEQARKQPDLFLQRSIGCLVGGILGPLLLIASVFVAAALYPKSGGSPVMFFLFMLIAVPIGGAIGAVLSPFIVNWINESARRNLK